MNTFTSSYTYMLFYHNWNILFFRCQFQFYKLFDIIECWYCVNFKKMSSLEYHVDKIVNQELFGQDFQKFIIVRFLLTKFILNEEELDAYSTVFMGVFLNKFTVNRMYLDWFTYLLYIKNVKDIIDFMFYINITSERNLTYILGKELYEKFYNASFKEASELVNSIKNNKQI